MSVLEYMEEFLSPYDHKIDFSPPNYYFILGDVAMAVGWRTIIEMESPTYDIHHTEECLEAQEAYYAFKHFIEEFGGYVPDGTCDCPRDEIPPKPKEVAEMIFRNLLHKYQSSTSTARKPE